MNPTNLLADAELFLLKRELNAAMVAFDGAEAAGAEATPCCAGRWLACMLQGNFEAAWAQSDRIRALPSPDPGRFWHGESFEGKVVIVRCLHGFGDLVQLFQYAPLLARTAARVWWEVPPEMLQVAPCFISVDDVTTWGESQTWEVQLEVTELPYILRTEIDDLPLQRNYLDLPEHLLRTVSRAMGPRTLPRVGVVWAAGAWNTSRSVPVEQLAKLLSIKEVDWWNLQGGSNRNELPGNAATLLKEIPACNDGILSLAAVITQLDLLVTVDTLAAHLAGALGIPTLLLLQHAADWRWMHGRPDTPWYQSVRLVRQPCPGAWTAVLDEARELVLAVAQQARPLDETSEIICSN